METILQRTAHHPFAGVKQVRYLTHIQPGGEQKDGSQLPRIQNVQQRGKLTFHSKIPLAHLKPNPRLYRCSAAMPKEKVKPWNHCYFRCASRVLVQVLCSMNEIARLPH